MMTLVGSTVVGNLISTVGFSPFEKSTILAFLRLAENRAPHWKIATYTSEASVVLLSASSQLEVDAYRSSISPGQRIILVGDSDFGTGWACMSRPLRLTAILAALNGDATAVSPSLTQVKTAPSASLTPTALGARFQTPEVKPEVKLEVKLEVKRDVSAAPLIPMNVAPGFTSASPVTQTDFRVAAGVQAPAISGHVLLVDDSDVALKFMNNRLKHFGYDCQLARSGEEALALVASHDFQFVFLDVMMTGLDGYQTCRAIKQNKARRGPAPVVVMLTSKGGTIDKIRGSMAGCDGYLTKPLNERHLASVLAKFDDSTVAERFAASNLSQPMVSTLKPRARLL